MEAIRLSRSLHKCFHVVMRLLDAEDKVEFFCHMLVGANVTDDPTSMTWIPKIMEIGLHFVKDDNRYVKVHSVYVV